MVSMDLERPAAGGVCEMQRLEEAYLDMADDLKQLYRCITQPVATLALGSTGRF